MEVKVEKLKDSKIKLIIEISPSEMAKFFKETFDKLSSGVKISGFRPGKAPRAIVESNIGVARILSESLDLAIQSTYYKALDKEAISAISMPNVSIDKYPNYGIGEEVTEPMVYSAELEVMPEIKLGDYSKLKIEKTEKQSPKKEDVDKVLSYFQKQKATFASVDRGAKKGDKIEVDFEGYLKKVKIDKMCSKNHPLVLGEGSLIPGFEEELIGMKKGEKKNFKITFPKDYHAKDMAGKEAEFDVEIIDIKEVNLPQLNDDFAKEFGHDKYGDLEKAIKENLFKEMEQQYNVELESKVLEKVLPLLESNIPQSLVERETERMMGDMEQQLKNQGASFDIYLKSIKKTSEEFKKDLQPQALKNVKIGLILSKVIDELKLDRNDHASAKKAIDHLVASLTKE